MAKTIRISKSKALNFKKLSFLYLIFIVFFFFSTSGDFIHHFIPLSKTQNELNLRLIRQVGKYQTRLPDELAMREKAMNALLVIHEMEESLKNYSERTKLHGERLKEQKFSKQYLLTEEPSLKLHTALSAFILGFPTNYQDGLAEDLGVLPQTLNLNEPIKNQFFLEMPNGAIGSVLNHLETVILNQTLKYFKQEIEDGGMVRIASSKDSSLLQGFKDVYYVGEDVTFDFYSRDSIAPTIRINQVTMTPQNRDARYKISWTPTAEGTYQLEANIGKEFIRRSFRVVKPSLRFLENEQEIAAFLGEPLYLTVDLNGLQNIRNLNFTSNGAEIETKKDELILTPLYEGRFTVEMRSGTTVLDTRSMFARKGKAPAVVLKDVAGEKTTMKNAHCLESLNPFWQVINFNMTLIDPNGQTVSKTKSQTRFLRNELRNIESTAAPGSTIIFDEIRLLNSNGATTAMGAPIFIGK